MKNETVIDKLKELLSADLDQRIILVNEDFKTQRNEYASIPPIELAKALNVPLNAIDGSQS